jgi:hypothetical protein
MSSERWDEFVRATLTAAGWFSGKDQSARIRDWTFELQGEGFTLFPAAERALREFGGLRVEVAGPGRECARSSFEVKPSLALGERDRFAAFEHTIGKRLFPLGEIEKGHAFLAIDEDGALYTLMDEGFLLGNDIDEAIARMIVGLRPRGAPIQPEWRS